MSDVNFDAKAMEITLVPFGTEDARKAGKDAKRVFTVYADYGNVKTRIVQGIVDRIGGKTVYLETWKDGKRKSVLPIPGSRGSKFNGPGTCESVLAKAANFIAVAAAHGLDATAMGSERVRWEIGFSTVRRNIRDAGDSDPSVMPEVAKSAGAPADKVLRKEF